MVKVNKYKSNLNNMAGMTVVMVFSMTSSVLLGLIAGIQYQGNLTVSTIVAICLGMLIGILIGIRINILALVEGVASSMMGGMMGAMLGEMLPPNSYQLMLVFTDVLFIITTLFLIFLIHTEAKKSGKDIPGFTPRISKWIITSVVSTLIILVSAQLEEKTVLSKTNNVEESNPIPDQNHDHHSHNH
jgi:uncharacterized membrane protein YfcA